MVNALTTVLRLLVRINDLVLKAGRTVGWIALALMVVVILAQVFFRYVLNAALPWPDEAARFLMLWMTGLIAPLAYRHAGFVAIEMVPQALGAGAGRALNFLLFSISLSVLIVAAGYGYDHAFGFGGNFDSSSLKIPLSYIGLETIRVKLRYMYMALFVCMILLISVNFELILRTLLEWIAPEHELPQPATGQYQSAGAD